MELTRAEVHRADRRKRALPEARPSRADTGRTRTEPGGGRAGRSGTGRRRGGRNGTAERGSAQRSAAMLRLVGFASRLCRGQARQLSAAAASPIPAPNPSPEIAYNKVGPGREQRAPRGGGELRGPGAARGRRGQRGFGPLGGARPRG